MKDKHLNDSIYKIARGVYQFQSQVFEEKKQLFETLAEGQQPKILFITCSDSRIDPTLITQTQPGDMFLVQNAGNIVPPVGSGCDGIGASIEYAVSVLNVDHIIVCGHSRCGAMAALLNMDSVKALPAVKHWLSFAEATRTILEAHRDNLDEADTLDYCTRMNLSVQLGHLKTLPSVATKLMQGKIALHGWLYDIKSGEIDVYDADTKEFTSFEAAYPLSVVGAV